MGLSSSDTTASPASSSLIRSSGTMFSPNWCMMLVLMALCLAASPVNAFSPSSHSKRSFATLRSTTDKEDTSSRPDLPDFGSTPVQVDQIRLKKVVKKKPSADSTADTTADDDDNKWRRKDLFGSTLVDQTLEELEKDADFQETATRYAELGPAKVSREERAVRRRALDDLGISHFSEYLEEKTGSPTLTRKEPKILQINVGLYCNQACGHCHVESSPLRKEMMTAETAAQCIELLKQTPSITTLDITGGAPELNAHFRTLVTLARAIRPDLEIIDRCNLTVLQEPGQEDLVDFLKQHRVRVIASLPCYGEQNVDQQRGSGVFDRSIAALLALNEAGYGTTEELGLDLVYNPLGAFLPPEQQALEQQYKQQLQDNFGILFDSLFTMTNMPIKRFADFLHRRDELKDYMDLLVRNFNVDTTKSLMCLDMVSVGWDGKVFDCDFNQQLGYDVGTSEIHGLDTAVTVFDLESYGDLQKYAIRNDNHCFGCTAGMGSS